MCPRVGPLLSSCGQQLWEAAQFCGASLTTGGIAPASLQHGRLTPVAEVAGPRCLAGPPLPGCVPARLSRADSMALGKFCMVSDAAWLGSNQRPWSNAPVRPILTVWFVVPCPSAA